MTVWFKLNPAFSGVFVLSSWDPCTRWSEETQVSMIHAVSFIPKRVLLLMACFSVSLKDLYAPFHLTTIRIVFNPKSWNQISLRISLLTRPVHGFGSVLKWCAQLPELSLARLVHRRPGLEYRIKTVHNNPNDYFHSQLPVVECFQSLSMLCPKPLQCLSPTLQPQSYQNSSHQFLFATPVHKTKRKAHLCSTNARAHLLFA